MPIGNIASVLRYGILSHERASRLVHRSVAMQAVQDKRDRKVVPGGQRLHRYANQYFHARNPMLSARRYEDVRVLRVSVSVLTLSGTIVTDQNAASDYVRFSSPSQCNGLDFDDIYARDWRHPDDQLRQWRHKSRKCAEVLVPGRVDPSALTGAMVALVNTVNCVGVMGKGVALEFKRRWPAMFDDYVDRCRHGAVKPGEPYLFEDASGSRILNFPTKDHWRSPSRLSDIERGLDRLAERHAAWGITSIAMPPLGCGNGGLSWSDVGPLIRRKLAGLPFDVEVYAPYGTPPSELTPSFLDAPAQMPLDDKGRAQDKMNPEWATLVEVLHRLESQPYAPPVGRVIFQKIFPGWLRSPAGMRSESTSRSSNGEFMP